ncbi:MAG: hypothetical protein N3D11_07695 [Candidatus Sumerlaeia bacterium]|nr:hypothetical protein [Candidatus Sumerlaeia bacterium]
MTLGRSLIGLACGILVCVAPAFMASSQPQPARGGGLTERFRKLDATGGGKLSWEEWRSLTNFDEMDLDRDGFLTPQEIGTLSVTDPCAWLA